MNNKSVRKYLITISILVSGLSATTASANWYVQQSEGYYKPKEYHNERYGDFVPADINQKLFGQKNTDDTPVESKTLTDTAPVEPSYNQTIAPDNQQARNFTQQYQQPAYNRYNQSRNYTSPVESSNNQTIVPDNQQAQNLTQQYQQPAYNRYNQNRNYTPPANRRNSRNTNFNGPWNNNSSSFSGPWNNNKGSNFSGPWNSNGSNFSGPWNNNGSNFSMPWGNNNGSNFSPFGNGGSWGW